MGVPGLSKLYVVERAMAIGSALVWLAVFVLLGVAELRCLVWLADGAPPGDSGLAAGQGLHQARAPGIRGRHGAGGRKARGRRRTCAPQHTRSAPNPE